jgi:hypothetical protein
MVHKPKPKRKTVFASIGGAIILGLCALFGFNGEQVLTSFERQMPMGLLGESTTYGVPPAFADQPAVVAQTFDSKIGLTLNGDGTIRTDAFADIVSSGETAFRTFCEVTHHSYNDPILYPGQEGASHLHTFYGNPTTDHNSTYTSLREATNNTAIHDDFGCVGGPLNGSGYWHPAVLDDLDDNEATTDDIKIVEAEFAIVYYKGSTGEIPDMVRLGRGFSYVFGMNPATGEGSNGLSFNGWSCNNGGTRVYSLADASGNATISCPAGTLLYAHFGAPECWTGDDLAVANGRDHVAKLGSLGAASGQCPASHPFHIPHFTFLVAFATNGPDDYKTWWFSSDRMPGYPVYLNGESGHADWLGAWQDDIMVTWMEKCIGLDGITGRNCGSSIIGDGRKLKGAPWVDLVPASYTLHWADLPEDPTPAVEDPVEGHQTGINIRRHQH